MSITASELKANLGKYLMLAETEKIMITQYGKTIAMLCSPVEEKLTQLENMKAKFPPLSNEEIDEIKWERLSVKCGL